MLTTLAYLQSHLTNTVDTRAKFGSNKPFQIYWRICPEILPITLLLVFLLNELIHWLRLCLNNPIQDNRNI